MHGIHWTGCTHNPLDDTSQKLDGAGEGSQKKVLTGQDTSLKHSSAAVYQREAEGEQKEAQRSIRAGAGARAPRYSCPPSRLR
jgi:hypothetical protein